MNTTQEELGGSSFDHEVVDLSFLTPTEFFASKRELPTVAGGGAALGLTWAKHRSRAGRCTTWVDVGEALARNFQVKGWCFVRLPPDMRLNQSEPAQLRTFFALDAEHKAAFAAPLAYGYSALAHHKEGYRVLTGSRLMPHQPKELKGWLRDFARCLDNCIVDLLLQCVCQKVFGMPPDQVARAADLPVSFRAEDHFGMLDFAHYHNCGSHPPVEGDGASVDEVNCVSHFDPGLLSVSFFSDRQGLQLKEPIFDTDGNQVGERWVDGPVNTVPGQEDLGVVWLGEAAVKVSQGKLKAGIHRVVYPADEQGGEGEGEKARLTGWYEVCTATQALGLAEKDSFTSAGEVSLTNLPSVVGGLRVEEGEQHFAFLKKVERKYGIPMRKSSRLSDMFKSFDEK